MTGTARPTLRDEQWRYADGAVLERLAPERFDHWRDLALAPGETRRECFVLDGAEPELVRLRVSVG